MLDTKQKEFVKVANENGLSGKITRSEIIDLGAKTGVKTVSYTHLRAHET